MTGNVFGERFSITSFGESHGKCVGVVVDGCPAGLKLNEEDVQKELNLRKPGQSLVTTTRAEKDLVEIMSGVFQGYTTGAPICMIMMNADVDSKSYEKILETPRPGHADLVARLKYGGFNDWRGGGRFSGRITATYVMAGAVAKKLLAEKLGIEVIAYSLEIGGIRVDSVDLEMARKFRYSNDVRCPDPEIAKRMQERILEEKKKGDSVGGIVECVASNVPLGLGEPVFESLDCDISKALMAIPACRGVEFGSGFASAKMTGYENNDPYTVRDEKILTTRNNSGGIVGGISNSMPLVLRVAFKPASSIGRPQRSVNIRTMEEAEIIVPGRHDPSVVPRAVPVVESVVASVLVDHALRANLILPVLSTKKES